MEHEIFCDKCGVEFPSHESMPDPETHMGDLCHECYINMSISHNIAHNISKLRHMLPSMHDLMKAHCKFFNGKSLDPSSLEDNCHSAASALVKMLDDNKEIDIKLQRGHWLGNDVRTANGDIYSPSIHQHSWTRISILDNDIDFIVDPTQWVFTGCVPSLYIGDSDDVRYDVGGYRMKNSVMGHRQFPERGKKLSKTFLDDGSMKWLSAVSKRDWSVWSKEEIFRIANIDPRSMGHHKKNIFDAIIESGCRGFIPLEGLAMAMGEM